MGGGEHLVCHEKLLSDARFLSIDISIITFNHTIYKTIGWCGHLILSIFDIDYIS